jgi:hypothetical protein
MFFDVKRELAELRARGVVSPPVPCMPELAEIAGIAETYALPREPATDLHEPPQPPPEAFQHGKDFSGRPKTWTGRIVSLDEWRRLTEWERDGPNGRHWCGITRRWGEPKE